MDPDDLGLAGPPLIEGVAAARPDGSGWRRGRRRPAVRPDGAVARKYLRGEEPTPRTSVSRTPRFARRSRSNRSSEAALRLAGVAALRVGRRNRRPRCIHSPSLARVEGQIDSSRRRIGRYLVLETLGQGGQGEVFRVLHPKIGKEFVLKLARRSIVADPVGRDRMLREGRLLAGFVHPNLVRVVDIDVHEGRPFVVMEHVQGLNLEQFAKNHRPAHESRSGSWPRWRGPSRTSNEGSTTRISSRRTS